MYAVIETGGKQYRVELGTELEVDQLDVEPGQSVTIDRVLLVADGDDTSVGRPLVSDAAVDAEVVRRDRGDKLIVYKYGPKTRRRVKKGHRQELTVLRITDLRVGGRSAAAAARKADRDAKTERQRLEEAAARQAAEDAALAAKLAERSKAETDTETKPKTGRTRATKPASPADGPSTKTRVTKATTKAAKSAETESAGPDTPTNRGRRKASSPTDDEARPDSPKRGRSKKSE